RRSADPAGAVRRPAVAAVGAAVAPARPPPAVSGSPPAPRKAESPMTSTHAPAHRARSLSVPAMVTRIAVLGTTLAVTVFIAPVLISQQSWMWLAVLLLSAAGIFVLYSTTRFVPGKYPFPGTFFLSVFLILPVVLTIGYSFTNYGDRPRGPKEPAVGAIVASAVQQSPDSPGDAMAVATSGSATEGPCELYLVNPEDGTVHRGDAE